MFHGIQKLEENSFGQNIIPHIMATLRDIGKKIPFRAIFDDDIGAIGSVENLNEGDDIRVGAGFVVKGNLSLLKSFLS